MAFDFPASPANGTEYTPAGGVTYVFNTPVWKVKPIAGGGGSGGGIPEAPINSIAYGRRDAAWTQVIMSTGDVVDGGNFITRDGIF